jgi:hypothetical protein
MKNALPRWFLVSLVHPALSTLGIILGSTNSGILGYAPGLLAFVANLPGVMLIKQFHRSTPLEPTATKYLVFVSMIGITWLLVVVPACYLASRFLSKRAAGSSETRG